jgi:hypothetical protein
LRHSFEEPLEPVAISFHGVLFRKAVKLPALASFFKAEISSVRHYISLFLWLYCNNSLWLLLQNTNPHHHIYYARSSHISYFEIAGANKFRTDHVSRFSTIGKCNILEYTIKNEWLSRTTLSFLKWRSETFSILEAGIHPNLSPKERQATTTERANTAKRAFDQILY